MQAALPCCLPTHIRLPCAAAPRSADTTASSTSRCMSLAAEASSLCSCGIRQREGRQVGEDGEQQLGEGCGYEWHAALLLPTAHTCHLRFNPAPTPHLPLRAKGGQVPATESLVFQTEGGRVGRQCCLSSYITGRCCRRRCRPARSGSNPRSSRRRTCAAPIRIPAGCWTAPGLPGPERSSAASF